MAAPARDGGYLVSSDMRGTAAAGADQGEYRMTMDISDIDNPANAVNPPK